MDVSSNLSLKQHNTFGIDVQCQQFVQLYNEKEAVDFVVNKLDKTKPYMAIGEGSNILFTRNFDGTLMQMQNKGFTVVDETNNNIWVRAAAGEDWDDFVAWCVENKYAGTENLSKIPGKVGAAPIQNIGAYGVELKELFNSLEAVEINSGEIRRFYLRELQFDYRYSIFKGELKNKYLITSVIFKLNKFPFFKIEYGNIKAELENMHYENLSIAVIREAVSAIRSRKLPEPKELGNAGSFFKNPVVDALLFSELKTKFPGIVAYKLDTGKYKLAAGWLIDNAGLKGFQKGNVGIHKNQALILVNLGGAEGKEVLDFSKLIQEKVFEKYGVELEREVNAV